MQTDFDESIGRIIVVPQEIGSVLLNLFNNAFYTVNEKKHKLDGAFEPLVKVVTKKENEKVIIKVIDNGFGISQNSVDKVFQPFFTTKPSGQGTGLGLSLSYDVIKAHDGTIKIETKEGEGTVFTVELPFRDA
jgi:signal transduction histidine kinase